MTQFNQLIEGCEYVDGHSYRVRVTGFARNALTKENYVMFKAVSFVQSGPHHMVAPLAWWVEKGFVEAPPRNESAKLGREGE
jgi:hypothetical protein